VTDRRPDWERVLSAACRLQQIVPSAVLVGGTATAIHTDHRHSHDADHVVADLRQRFDQVLADLESAVGWQTARINRPVQILGSLDGIESGVRQLIRISSLETEQVVIGAGHITVPTKAEMLRIKAWLAVRRNATRDYIDLAALALNIGHDRAAAALGTLDALYPQPAGQSVLQQLMKQLADPQPYDIGDAELNEYRDLAFALRDWSLVTASLRKLSVALIDDQLPAT
jgi:hypothetical protein